MNMNEQEVLERIAAMRMQIAAMHTALRYARQVLAEENGLEGTLAQVDEALAFGEPDGIAIFATARSICAAARDPERLGQLPELADRLERFIAAHDGE